MYYIFPQSDDVPTPQEGGIKHFIPNVSNVRIIRKRAYSTCT